MAKRSKSKSKGGSRAKLATVRGGKAAPKGVIGRIASKVAAVSPVGRAVSAVSAARGGRGMRRSRKKSAYWYASQIQRLKLKRKYDKLRLGVSVR